MRAAPRSRPRGVRGTTATLILLLAACGEEQKACDPGTLYTPTPTDCATLSSRTDWGIGSSSAEIELFVGQSRRVGLSPYSSISDCRDQVTVTWRMADGQVASVVPDPTFISAWVTGLDPGSTRVTARIRFADGVERETAPTVVRTTPPDPPTAGSRLLAEGTIEIAEGTAPDTRWYFVSFRLPEPGRVDMTLDWDSPLLTANFVLWAGACSSQPCPGAFIPLQDFAGIKPMQKSISTLQPGEYTLRLDYNNAAAVVLRYGVRLTPSP